MLPGEAVSEVLNATVHAFLCQALRKTESGYRLYWGVYVKPVTADLASKSPAPHVPPRTERPFPASG
jgi:hypothetical protein